MTICAFETSCDETAVALLKDGHQLLSNVVASQIKWHKAFGGVVPELASRMHAEKIHLCIDKAFSEAQLKYQDIDAIGVTYGPGLEGALLVGISVAKSMATVLNKPLIPINHLHGHIYSSFYAETPPQFPFLCLLVSGGHTLLVHAKSHFDFELLGTTRDDACGEAFDKVARVLGLPYPGGPHIETLAKEGDDARYDFPRAMKRHPFEFSFSGLKTSVAQTAAKLGASLEEEKPHIAASFQKAVGDVLIQKSIEACQTLGLDRLVVCGGVMANRKISDQFQIACRKLGIELVVPPLAYCTDNAAMIAMATHHYIEQGIQRPTSFTVTPNLKIDTL